MSHVLLICPGVLIHKSHICQRRTMEELQLLSKRWGLAVELDETGKIRRSIHDPSGLRVSEVLEVTEYIGVFYVGTRAQHAAVRVVGAPSELNVDSLVQVGHRFHKKKTFDLKQKIF